MDRLSHTPSCLRTRFSVWSLAAFAQIAAINASAQTPPPPTTLATPVAKSAPAVSTEPSRTWHSLTAAEQAALKPLEGQWSSIGPLRQKKWLEISKNYATLPPAQQQAMQERMAAWAKMSPSERTQARLNFAETQKAASTLTPDEKKARWEAYQALSPEEKQRLAKVQSPPKTAAPVIKPVPPQKLTSLPQVTATTGSSPRPGTSTHAPRIATQSGQVQNHTLLPQPTKPASQ